MRITRSWRAAPRSTSCAPRSNSNPAQIPTRPAPQPSITKTTDGPLTCWRIKLAGPAAATFDAALQSHHDALIADWKRDHPDSPDGAEARSPASGPAPPLPTTLDAFIRLVEAGWDTDVAARPHGQRTTVVVHLDVESAHRRAASGPAAGRRRPPLPDLRRHLRGLVRTARPGHRRRAGDPADQPAAAPRAGAPRPLLRGPRLRGHPRSARPPHPALGRRRPHRAGQPGAGLPLSPPAAPPRRHHHHRTRTPSRHHRQRRPTTQRRLPGPPTNHTPTRGTTRAPDPAANAPTGGGTNPSNHNHHQPPTKLRYQAVT